VKIDRQLGDLDRKIDPVVCSRNGQRRDNGDEGIVPFADNRVRLDDPAEQVVPVGQVRRCIVEQRRSLRLDVRNYAIETIFPEGRENVAIIGEGHTSPLFNDPEHASAHNVSST
jgi:hypothetical protein